LVCIKNMKTTLYFIWIIILTSCFHKNSDNIVCEKFQIPVITQTKLDSSVYYNSDSLSFSMSWFVGKYKFCDTVNLTSKDDTTNKDDLIRDFVKPNYNDSLFTDGLQIIVDYQNTIIQEVPYLEKNINCYPVFVINETNSTKILTGKDSHVFIIQEALDSSKQWHPINGKGFDFCGNGHWGVKIYPKEFALFLAPKYNGDFETLIRIRLKIGDNIYVTKPFTGKIKYSQFYLRQNDIYSRRMKDEANAIMSWFYGSPPKGIDHKENSYIVWTQ
jgi:hypothetical protein